MSKLDFYDLLQSGHPFILTIRFVVFSVFLVRVITIEIALFTVVGMSSQMCITDLGLLVHVDGYRIQIQWCQTSPTK